jgi:hypothetical protein
MRTPKLIFLSGFLLCGGLAACQPNVEDDSLYLTGTEEGYLLRNGQKECNGKKVLICHIPPGNPANAHTICVGEPAVEPHQTHHGDTLGECVVEPTPPPEDPPPPDDDDDDDDDDPPPPPPPDGGDGSGSDGPIL